jgi:hypothetical protein
MQLMQNCRDEIEQYLQEEKNRGMQKKAYSKMKKSASYLSMENLDLNEENGAESQESENDEEKSTNFL